MSLNDLHLHFLEMARRRTLQVFNKLQTKCIREQDKSPGWDQADPHITHLHDTGLITVNKTRDGTRQVFRLTPKGRQALKDAWRNNS
jgi:hypothetical protein